MEPKLKWLGDRFQSLLGDVVIDWADCDPIADSPESFMEIGRKNLRQLEKIKAMPEEQQLRIKELLFNIVATVLQKEAMQKYGNTNDSSIRQCLNDWYKDPDNYGHCNRIIELGKQELSNCGLTDAQLKVVYEAYDELLLLMMQTLIEEISRLRLIPLAQSPGIAAVLADMVKETLV